MVAGPRRAHRTPPALVVVASSYAAAWFPQRPRGRAFFPLPSRERRGPIAQQWGGEGVGATARLRQQTPHPPPFTGPLPLPLLGPGRRWTGVSGNGRGVAET